MGELETRVNYLADKSDQNKNDNRDNRDRVEVLEKDLNTIRKDQKTNTADIISEATKSWSSEQREREAIKTNLIIYGLTETPLEVTASHARKAQDTIEVESMFAAIGASINIESDTKYSVRLGTLGDNVTDKPRPLKIGFKVMDKLEEVYTKAKNLAKSMDYKHISISPDLTELQRAEDRELMDEAQQRNDDMSTEDALNFEFRCIGRRGQRIIQRFKIDSTRPRRPRFNPTDRRQPHLTTSHRHFYKPWPPHYHPSKPATTIQLRRPPRRTRQTTT